MGTHDLSVVRQRRGGQDRLYVRLHDGSTVGWFDLSTGEETLLREDLRDEFNDVMGGPGRQPSPAPA